MLDSVTPEEVVAEAKMLRAASAGAILIVEGASDSKFWNGFIEKESCEIIIARGKDNVLDAIKALNLESFLGALAFVDADFWRVDGTVANIENLVVSDLHDVEMMMLVSGALEKVLAEHGNKEKIAKKLKAESIKTVLQLALRETKKLADLRYVNHQKQWPLSFKELKWSKFTNADSLEINQREALRLILANSKTKTIKEKDVLDVLEANNNCKIRSNDLREYCSGHDCTNFLAVSLRKCLGSLNGTDACRDKVESCLRLAYGEKAFSNTNLFEAIRKWELGNPSYKIVRELDS